MRGREKKPASNTNNNNIAEGFASLWRQFGRTVGITYRGFLLNYFFGVHIGLRVVDCRPLHFPPSAHSSGFRSHYQNADIIFSEFTSLYAHITAI